MKFRSDLLLSCNNSPGSQLRYKHLFKSASWFYCFPGRDATTFLTVKLSVIISKQLTQKLLNSVKVRGLIGFICNVFEKLIKTPHTAEETGNTIFSFSPHEHSQWAEVNRERQSECGNFTDRRQILSKWNKTENASPLMEELPLFIEHIQHLLYTGIILDARYSVLNKTEQ